MSMNLQTTLIAIGVAAIIADRVLDALGLSRSSKALRRENEDLGRYNAELERTVERLEQKVTEQAQDIAMLRGKVDELAQRDQAAVLLAIRVHEENAERRHQRGEIRHTESLDALREIRDALTPTTSREALS